MTPLTRWIRRTPRNNTSAINASLCEPYRPRFRPVLLGLESRDATGTVLTGVALAALGGPFPDPLQQMAALVGDAAMLLADGGRPVPAGDPSPVRVADTKYLGRLARWLPDDALRTETVEERRHTTEYMIAAPFAPASEHPEEMPRYLLHQGGMVNIGPSLVGPSVARGFMPTSVPHPQLHALDSFLSSASPRATMPDSTAPSFGTRVGMRAAELIAAIPNDAPEAVNDAVNVNEDESVLFDPTVAGTNPTTTKDTDPNGDPLWVKYVQGETDNGRTYWEDGKIRYTPNPDFHGAETFTYTVTDGLAEDVGTVTVTVAPVNDEGKVFDDFRPFGLFLDYNTPADDRKGQFGSLFANDIDYDYGTSFGLKLAGLKADGATAFGTGVGPYSLDFGAKGVVTVLADGTGGWTQNGPNYYFGRLDIAYRVTDEKGWTSDWATATLNGYWPEYPYVGETDPTVTAGADAFAIGDEIKTGYVTDNDSEYEFVVLNGHPPSGRLVSFDRAGGFEYQPSASPNDAVFGYTAVKIWGPNHWEAVNAQVTATKVNLTLHHGGNNDNPKPVLELNERVLAGGAAGGSPLIPAFKATGGFTVANLNDSDVDGVLDSIDPHVPANGAYPGSGEKDLMRLDLKKPQAIAGQKVKLTVTPSPGGTVNLWKSSEKGNNQQWALTNNMIEFAVDASFPTTLWVELTGISGSVGDVKIESKYGEAGATDSINATGIWMQNAQNAPFWPAGSFMNTGNALPADADARGMKELFKEYGSTLGLVTNKFTGVNVPRGAGDAMIPANITANVEVSKFTTMPIGLTPFVELGIVSFDVTRSVEDKGSVTIPYEPPVYVPGGTTRPNWLDTVNDEYVEQGNPAAISRDNDNDLVWVGPNGPTTTDNLYSIDAPGMHYWYSGPGAVWIYNDNRMEEYPITDQVQRMNAFDFVRVRIGNHDWTSGPGLQGSRASVFYHWHSLFHARTNPPAPPSGWTTYRFNDPLTPAGKTENEIATGLIDINVIGG